MNYNHLAQASALIIGTYLLALLPWSIITALDFISSDWKTVRATRRSGYYHFFFVAIPLPLIIFYILVNWSAMERHEACAAFLVLYVSFVHFLRTSWGLWHLYLFHNWATEAIESMEQMGYEYNIRLALKKSRNNKIDQHGNKKEQKDNNDSTHKNIENKKQKKKHNIIKKNQKKHKTKKNKSIKKLKHKNSEYKSDLILVNNTIVDNPIFHGETQCYIQYRGITLCIEKDPYGEIPFWKKWVNGIKLSILLPIIPLIWIIDITICTIHEKLRYWSTGVRYLNCAWIQWIVLNIWNNKIIMKLRKLFGWDVSNQSNGKNTEDEQNHPNINNENNMNNMNNIKNTRRANILNKVHYKDEYEVLHQLPHKPVEVWLNWASVFVSQGLHECIDEFEVAQDPNIKKNKQKYKSKRELYKARRDYFGIELLAGMCHLSDMKSHESTNSDRIDSISKNRSSNSNNSNNSNNNINNIEKNKSESISMISKEWDNKCGVSDGMIKKRELLLEACKSGKGLPFGAKHMNSEDDERMVEGLEEINIENIEEFTGYEEYEKKLERIVGSLPVTFGNEIQGFDIEQLEWLTILLYMGWKKKSMEKENEENGDGVDRKQEDGNEDEYEDNQVSRRNRNRRKWKFNQAQNVLSYIASYFQSISNRGSTSNDGSNEETETRDEMDVETNVESNECKRDDERAKQLHGTSTDQKHRYILDGERSCERDRRAEKKESNNREGTTEIYVRDVTSSNVDDTQYPSMNDETETVDIFDFDDDENNRHTSICPNEKYPPYQNLLVQYGFSHNKQLRSKQIKKSNAQRTSRTDDCENSRNGWSMRNTIGFPFGKDYVRDECMKVSRYNRHVLRVGEVSDVWIQLEAGRQYKFLQEKNEWWKRACLGKEVKQLVEQIIRKKMENLMNENRKVSRSRLKDVMKESERVDIDDKLESETNNNLECEIEISSGDGIVLEVCDDGKVEEVEKKETIGDRRSRTNEYGEQFEHVFQHVLQGRQRQAELSRLEYQLADCKQKYRYMDHNLSFMGYSMEHVRSELGEWMWNIKQTEDDEKKEEEEADGRKRVEWGEESCKEAWRPAIIRSNRESIQDSKCNKTKSETNNTWRCGTCTNVGLLSRKLSKAMLELRDRRWLHKTSVQVRLLWETQQLLQEEMRRRRRNGKGGPQDIVSIMLCILSFPALVMTIIDEEARKEDDVDDKLTGDEDSGIEGDKEVSCDRNNASNDDVMVADDNEGNCMVQFCAMGKSREFLKGISNEDKDLIVERARINIEPPCAPQELNVMLQFRVIENERVSVGMRLEGKQTKNGDLQIVDAGNGESVEECEQEHQVMETMREKEPERFEWEWWKNSFHSRLEGLSAWQKLHEMSSVKYEDTKGRIDEGVTMVKMSEMGTGKEVRMWKGWCAFRKLFCRFELESPEYIMTYKRREPLQLNRSDPDQTRNISSTFSLYRMERTSVKYEKAGWRELFNSSVSLGLSHEPERNKTVRSYLDETDDTFASSYDREWDVNDRGVLLLQELAIEEGDGESLERCVKMISDGKYLEKDLKAAIELLEAFVSGGAMKGDTKRRGRKEIDNRLMIASRIGMKFVEYFADDEVMLRKLFELIVQSCYVTDDNEIRTKVSWLLGNQGRLFMELGTHAVLNDTASTMWRFSKRSVGVEASINTREMGRIKVNDIIDEAQKNILVKLLFERAVEKEEDVNVMNNLGLLLKYGGGE